MQIEAQESQRQHEEQVIRPLPTVHNEIPLDVATPQNVVRRRLPIVPPTPFDEDILLSQMIIDQDPRITVLNTPSIQANTPLVQPTPTERRRLPLTPLERSRATRKVNQNTSSENQPPQINPPIQYIINTPEPPVNPPVRNIIDRPVNPIAANRFLRGNAEPINNQGRMQLRVNTPVNPVIDREIDQTPKTRTRTARRLEIGLQFTGGKPDCIS